MKKEHHYSNRLSWIRAFVLGANDGIISMSALVVGLAATNLSRESLIIGSSSALIAGALSMWAGEYISVCSQADSEQEDIKREKKALKENPEIEFEELVQAYIEKGLSEDLSRQVATQLSAEDPLKAHLLEELNFDEEYKANPWQAAFVSFFAFLLGGVVPTLVGIYSSNIQLWIYPVTIICLAFLGYISAVLGGSKPIKGILRIVLIGIVVLLITNSLGSLVHQLS